MKTKLLILSILLMGSICYAQRKASEMPLSRARNLVLENVGSTAPIGVKLYQSYEEKYEYNKRETFSNHRFSCNSSRFLTGTVVTTFESVEGNLVKGVRVDQDECDKTNNSFGSRYNVEGRFNADYLFLYNIDNSKTNVYQFEIENNGKRLKHIKTYQIKKENITSRIQALNSEMWSDKITTVFTTYDEATSNYFIGDEKRITNDLEGDVTTAISLSEKLIELKNIYEKGIITNEEYINKKKQLLEEY